MINPDFAVSCYKLTLSNARSQLHAARLNGTTGKIHLLEFRPDASCQPHHLVKFRQPLDEIDVFCCAGSSVSNFIKLAAKAGRAGTASSLIAKGGEADIMLIKASLLSHPTLLCKGVASLEDDKLYAAKVLKVANFRNWNAASEHISREVVNTCILRNQGIPVMQLQGVVAFRHDGDKQFAPYALLYKYAEDGSLADILRQGRVRTLNKRLQYSIQMLEICASLSAGTTLELQNGHRFTQWMIHRDIKPNNFLLYAGRLHLIDCSLATMCPEGYAQLPSKQFDNIFNPVIGTSDFILKNMTVQRDPSATLASMLMALLGVSSPHIRLRPWSDCTLTAGGLEVFSWLHSNGLLRKVMQNMQECYSVPGGTLTEQADAVCDLLELLAVMHNEGLYTADALTELQQKLCNIAVRNQKQGSLYCSSSDLSAATQKEAVLLEAAVHSTLASISGRSLLDQKCPFFLSADERMTHLTGEIAAAMGGMLPIAVARIQDKDFSHLQDPATDAAVLRRYLCSAQNGDPRLGQELLLLDLPVHPVQQSTEGPADEQRKRSTSHSRHQEPPAKAPKLHQQDLDQQQNTTEQVQACDPSHVVKLTMKAFTLGPKTGFGDALRLWNHYKQHLASALSEPAIAQCASWIDAPADKHIQHIAVYHTSRRLSRGVTGARAAGIILRRIEDVDRVAAAIETAADYIMPDGNTGVVSVRDRVLRALLDRC